ncbi:uncharacterized protein LOC129227471 [Uloborus diversus]|uniref:uncharacterized protein LOC129227471 n=1 Tax=Uloborus diversus TaxID=327109 RepID=UPI0024094739|nr:uncharacterized protein LOC129227471 [Uloborus diversus]
MYSNNKSFKGLVPKNFSEQLNVSSLEFDIMKNSRRESGSMSSKQSEWLPLHHYRNAREQEFGSRPQQHSSLYANTPIYSDNEIQFHSSSLQNKIGSFTESLLAESMNEKAKLGLIEDYGQHTSLYSPGLRNWSNIPTGSSVGSLVDVKQFKTNIAKLHKDHISEDSLYISHSSNLNTKAERPNIQPISDLKLESIDDEDEYLYGDSNSIPELSVKEISKPSEEIPVKNESAWSDEEELSDLHRRSTPNSWESSEWRTGYKPTSSSERALSQISKEKRSAMQNLDVVQTKNKLPPSDKLTKGKTSHVKPQILSSTLKKKPDSFAKYSDETKLKDLTSELKSTMSVKKKSSQIPLKELPSEKRSKYSVPAELRKKSSVMIAEKPDDNVKKKLLDDKKSQKYPEREVRSKQLLSEKEVSILSPSRLEKIYVNINRDETFSKKRTVLVKETTDSFPDLDDCEIIPSMQKETTNKTKFNIVQKDTLPFSLSEKYSVVPQRTVRNVSDSPTLKRVVHNTALNPAKETQSTKTVVGKEDFKVVKNVSELTIPKPQDVNVLEKKVATNIKEKSIKKNSPTDTQPLPKTMVQKKAKYYLSSEKSPAHYAAEASPYGSRERSPRRHSRERSPRHHSRERSPRRHSRERSPRRHSRERSSRHHSRERRHHDHYSRERSRSPRHHSYERSPRHHSYERSPRHYSHERSPRHYSYERSPRHYSHERSPKHYPRDKSPRRHSRERSPRYHSYERSPRHHAHEKSPKRYESDSRYEDYKSRGRSGSSYAKPPSWEHGAHESRRSHKEYPLGKSQLDENLYKSYSHERDLNEGLLEQSSEESSHSSPERTVSGKNRSFPGSKSSKLPSSDSVDTSPSEREDDLTKKLALLRKAKMITDSGAKKSDLEKSLPSKEEKVVKGNVDDINILGIEENDANEEAAVSEVSKAQSIQKISFVINRKQLPTEVSHPVESPLGVLTKNEAPVSGIPSIISPPSVEPPVHPFQQYGYSPMVPSSYPPSNFPYPAVPPAPPMMPYSFPPTIPPTIPYYPTEIDPTPKIVKRPVHRVCSLKNIPTVSDVNSAVSHDPTSPEKFSEMQVYNQNHPGEYITTDSRNYTNSDIAAEPAHQTMKKSGLIQISCKQPPTKQNPVATDEKAAINTHIENYKKLLEDRNQLLKKLKMHNKTVSDLDAAKTNIERKCPKVKSTFDRQICSQFESLIENTKLELTRVIEMSRNVTSELQKLKVKIPPQLLSQIQESVKTTESEPESSVVYNFFDSGNHWCQHCNKAFATIPMLLQHFHIPGHPPCFDFMKKPWHSKEKESPNPDQLKDAKLESVKGVEFLVPVSGFYCSLCHKTFPDANFAEKHVKSHDHFLKYKTHIKENPVYENIKVLVRSFEQAHFQKERRKREEEEKQLLAIKRKKVSEEKVKEIKSQIETEKQNEKTVTELCDDNVSNQRSKNDNATSNIKLHLVEEKNSEISKQVKTNAKPNFIGRAPNYKSRLKTKSHTEGSPYDVKNAAESKKEGKQIQVIVTGAVIKPKTPNQLENEKSQKETNKPKEAAKILPSIKTDNSPVKKSAENVGTTSNSTVQLSEIKLPPAPSSKKEAKATKTNIHPAKHSVEEEKDFLMLGINRNDFEPLAVPKPPPANLIQNVASPSRDTNTTRNTSSMQSAITQKNSEGISSAPSQVFSPNSAQGMSPVNIAPSAPHVIQYTSSSVPAFNPSYPPPETCRSAVQSTLPIPPFPPPLQVPPPNVILKCAQSNVHLPGPGQHNLSQYSVTSPQKFSNVPFAPTLNAMSNAKSSFDQSSPTKTEHHSHSNLPVVNVSTKNCANDGKTGNKAITPSKDSIKSGKSEPSSIVKHDMCVQTSSNTSKKNENITKKIFKPGANTDESKMSGSSVSTTESKKINAVDPKPQVSSELSNLPTETGNNLEKEIQEASPEISDEPDKIISTDVDFGAFFTMSSMTREKRKNVENENSEVDEELCIKNASCAEKNSVSSSVPEAKKRKCELLSVSASFDTKSSDVQLDKPEFPGKNDSFDPPNISESEPSLAGSNLPQVIVDDSCLSKSTTDGTEIAVSLNKEMSSNQNSEAEKGKCELSSMSTNSSGFQSDKPKSPGKDNGLIDPPNISASEPSLEGSNLPKATVDSSCLSKTTTDGTEIPVSANRENTNSDQKFCDLKEDKEKAKDSYSQKDLSTSYKNDNSSSAQKEDNNLGSINITSDAKSASFQNRTVEPSDTENISLLEVNSSEKSHDHGKFSGVSSSLENTSEGIESVILQSSESATISQRSDACASDESCSLNVTEENKKDINPSDKPSLSENKPVVKFDVNASEGSEGIILQSSESTTISQRSDACANDESCSLNVTEENKKDISPSDKPSLSEDKPIDKPDVHNIENEKHNSNLDIQHLSSQSSLITESDIKSELSSDVISNETNISSSCLDQRTNLVSSISDIEPKVEPVTVDQDVTFIKKDVETNDQQIVDDKKEVLNDEAQSQHLIPPVLHATDVKNLCESKCLDEKFSSSYKSKGTTDEDQCAGLNHSENETEHPSSDLSAATEPEQEENLLEKQGEKIHNCGSVSLEESLGSANFSCPPESVIDDENLVVSEKPSSLKVPEVVLDDACALSSACITSSSNHYSKQENSTADGNSTTLDIQENEKDEHQNDNVHILTGQVNVEKSQNLKEKSKSESDHKKDLLYSHETSTDNIMQCSADSSPSISALNEQISGTETVVNIPDLTPNALSSVDLSGIKSIPTDLSNTDKEATTVAERCLTDENISNPAVVNAPGVAENANSVSQQGALSEDLTVSLLLKSDDKLLLQPISDDLSKSESVSHQTCMSETVSQVHEAKGNEVEKETEKNEIVESSAVQVCEVQEENVCEKNETCKNELAKVDADVKTEESVPDKLIVSTNTKEEPASCELVSDIIEENKDGSDIIGNSSEERKEDDERKI